MRQLTIRRQRSSDAIAWPYAFVADRDGLRGLCRVDAQA